MRQTLTSQSFPLEPSALCPLPFAITAMAVAITVKIVICHLVRAGFAAKLRKTINISPYTRPYTQIHHGTFLHECPHLPQLPDVPWHVSTLLPQLPPLPHTPHPVNAEKVPD
jgi:hypothetical protein